MKCILLITALLGAARGAGACSCITSTLARSFEQHGYVVRARVEQVLDTVQYDLYSRPVHPPFRVGYQVRLRILRTYKGTLPTSIQAGGMGSNCDFRFFPDKEYVLFLERGDKQYITSICALNFMPTDTAALRQVERLAAAK